PHTTRHPRQKIGSDQKDACRERACLLRRHARPVFRKREFARASRWLLSQLFSLNGERSAQGASGGRRRSSSAPWPLWRASRPPRKDPGLGAFPYKHERRFPVRPMPSRSVGRSTAERRRPAEASPLPASSDSHHIVV